MKHLFALLFVYVTSLGYAATDIPTLVGTWELKDGKHVFQLSLKSDGRGIYYDAVEESATRAVGTRLGVTYSLDSTRTPAYLVVIFDRDQHYPPDAGLRAIVEVIDPESMRFELVKAGMEPPRKFGDQAVVLKKKKPNQASEPTAPSGRGSP